MKNIYIIGVLLFFVSLTACYQDLGNYDYSELDELTIEMPTNSYNLALGQELKINPVINTSIPETDLNYEWEVFTLADGASYTDYVKFADGKNLNYTINLNTLMPSLVSYKIRLHINQLSTGRVFYSPAITFTIVGKIKGLMVLHGDDKESDIGLITAYEFMPASTDTLSGVTILPAYYSAMNQKKIQGRGKSIIQYVPSYMKYSANGTAIADVIVITDKESVVGSYSNIGYIGDWNSMFYGNVNKGKPESFSVATQYGFAVDSGELYIRTPFSMSKFITADPAGYGYYLGSTVFMTENTTFVQGFFFDKLSRGFIGISYLYKAGSGSSGIFPITTTSPFNAADMKANLLHIDRGGLTNHYLAVMQDDNGNRFLADLNPNQTKQSKVSVAKYDLSTLPYIVQAKYFAFGTNLINMSYYATSGDVYRFTASNGNSLTYSKLKTTAGDEISFANEEITMMKILKPEKTESPVYNYFNSNKILLVGTFSGTSGSGKIYSFSIDQLTGNVISNHVYTGFNRIYDADIKGI